MTDPILITGGTGNLGTHVVRRLLDTGADLRVLSRAVRTPKQGIEHVVFVSVTAADRIP